MTYQIIYSSESTMPMQTEDLEELLKHASERNGIRGISGALVYAEGMFLQILEGPSAEVQALMAKITRDVRHQTVTILQEGEITAPRFRSWKMAYVSATAEQVARWAGIEVAAGKIFTSHDRRDELDRTAQFAQDILALLTADNHSVTAPATKAPR